MNGLSCFRLEFEAFAEVDQADGVISYRYGWEMPEFQEFVALQIVEAIFVFKYRATVTKVVLERLVSYSWPDQMNRVAFCNLADQVVRDAFSAISRLVQGH